MSFTVDRIDHVEVFVRDMEKSIRWYEKVLGLKEIRRWDPHPVMMGAGGTMLALFHGDKDASDHVLDRDRSSLRWRRVAWQTTPENFQTAQDHLKSCGVEFEGPIDHDCALSIYFTDLDSHPLEITCYKNEETL